jgi:hypothetical protein
LPESPHLVYISIVGSDLVSFGYTREKLEAELGHQPASPS